MRLSLSLAILAFFTIFSGVVHAVDRSVTLKNFTDYDIKDNTIIIEKGQYNKDCYEETMGGTIKAGNGKKSDFPDSTTECNTSNTWTSMAAMYDEFRVKIEGKYKKNGKWIEFDDKQKFQQKYYSMDEGAINTYNFKVVDLKVLVYGNAGSFYIVIETDNFTSNL